MRTDHTLLTGTLAAAALLAVPASASALRPGSDLVGVPAKPTAVITAGKLAACYTAGHNDHASQHLELRGGTPGDTFLLGAGYVSNGRQVSDLGGISRFNAKGDARASFSAFTPPGDPTDTVSPGGKVQLSVKELTPDGAKTFKLGTTSITVQALSVDFDSPSSPNAAHNVAVSGTRFAHQKVYGFITAQSGSQVLRSFFLGEGNACGYVKRPEYVAPASFAAGAYELYVNAGAKLNKSAALSEKFTFSAAG